MNDYTLSTEQIEKLSLVLGLDKNVHRTQRIVIDIDCDRVVHVYTMAIVNGNQLTDLFSTIDNLIPSGSSETKVTG